MVSKLNLTLVDYTSSLKNIISKEIAQAEHYGNGGEWDRVNQVIKSSFVIVYVSFWNEFSF